MRALLAVLRAAFVEWKKRRDERRESDLTGDELLARLKQLETQ